MMHTIFYDFVENELCMRSRTEMLLILKKNYFRRDYSRPRLRCERPEKCPTILNVVNLWLKPV